GLGPLQPLELGDRPAGLLPQRPRRRRRRRRLRPPPLRLRRLALRAVRAALQVLAALAQLLLGLLAADRLVARRPQVVALAVQTRQERQRPAQLRQVIDLLLALLRLPRQVGRQPLQLRLQP